MNNLFSVKDQVVVITGGTGFWERLLPPIWQKKVPRLLY